jgi:DNA-directed RNA polymerase specialized sigma24 family protein
MGDSKGCYLAAAVEAAADTVPPAELAKIVARDAALREALLGWAMRHTRHPQNAEDLVSDTLTTALDPQYAGWDRARYATAGAFLGSVMNGLARNRVRSSYLARRADLDEHDPPQVAAPAADPEVQLQLAARERKREAMEAALRARLADKPVPLAVLDWSAKGVRTNVALAEKIGCTVAQAVAAKQMLRDHGAIVRAERASEPGAA